MGQVLTKFEENRPIDGGIATTTSMRIKNIFKSE